MGDATTEFFEGLRGRHEPSLETTSGTLRVERRDGKRTERWLVTIDKGDIEVSRKSGNADCIIRGPAEVIDGITTGAVNAFAALLRGEVNIEGNSRMLVRFQRLFPAPKTRAASSDAAQR